MKAFRKLDVDGSGSLSVQDLAGNLKSERRKKKKEGGRKDREWVKKKTLLRSRSAECRGVPNADQWMDSTPF